jgi:alanine racemase
VASDRPAGIASPLARADTILEIDLDAVAGNWRRLAARVTPGTQVAAVVKADAYGLGMGHVGPALFAAGCRLFFVANLDEGLALRRHMPDADIAVFNGPTAGTEAEFTAARLLPVLNDLGQIDAWRRVGSGPAVLHIDTGMARLGLSPDEVAALIAEPERLAGLSVAAIISHLACADEPTHALNPQQCATFRTLLGRLPPAPASLAASFGIFLGPDYHFTMVRPGAALYGINPLPGQPNPMAQVVHLKAKILQVREIDSGMTVGYGAAHRMDRGGRVATVAVGYADGWLRSASQRGQARIAGQPAPVIGRISMDLVTLDVTDIDPQLTRPGTYAVLLDSDYGVDQAAAAAGTIGYEILTSLGHRRYTRVYRGGAS